MGTTGTTMAIASEWTPRRGHASLRWPSPGQDRSPWGRSRSMPTTTMPRLESDLERLSERGLPQQLGGAGGQLGGERESAMARSRRVPHWLVLHDWHGLALACAICSNTAIELSTITHSACSYGKGLRKVEFAVTNERER